MLKSRALSCFLFFCFMQGVAVQAQTALPEIVPPSPQSRNFQKYGDYQVSHSTGVPDISIPLYTIESGDLKVPIVLRYHAAGINPKDPDLSNMGTGWTLDVGGLISRTVRGKADEMYRRTYFESEYEIDQKNPTDLGELSSIVSARTKDAEHDFFSYSFLGNSGKFVIKEDAQGVYKAYPLPFVPYKFNIQTGAPTCPWGCYKSIQGMNITDDKGIQYKFGYANQEIATADGEYAPTGWFLEEIKNASNTNQVQFGYATIPDFTHITYNWSSTVGDDGVPLGDGHLCAGPSDPYEFTCQQAHTSMLYRTKNIQTITFKNGRIEFTLSSSKRHIESMQVYDASNQVVKSFVFNRELFPGTTRFYKLKSIEIKDRTGVTKEKYGFSYNETVPIPDSESTYSACRHQYRTITVRTPARRSSDMVFSGPIVNFPQTDEIRLIGNADVPPQERYTNRYILERIQYPLGGTTQFSYEANEYKDWLNPATVSPHSGWGYRIKKIESKDNVGNSTVKTYEYEPGDIDIPVSNDIYSEPFSVRTSYNISLQCDDHDQFGGSISGTSSYYIYRSRVFSNYWNSNLGDNRIRYTKITEYTGDKTVNSGKTIYTYAYENGHQMGVSDEWSKYIEEYRDWGNGLLMEKEIFKRTGVNVYAKIKHLINDYEFKDIDTLYNLYTTTLYNYSGNSGDDPLSAYYLRLDMATQGFHISETPDPCGINDYRIVIGAFYLKSTEEKDYSESNILTTLTEHKYDNPANYYPTETKVTLSDGSKKVTRYKYPQDLTGAVYATMLTKNIIDPIVEQSEYKATGVNETFLQTIKTNFKDWGSNIIAPETVEAKTFNNPSEVRLRYHAYDDNGNVTSVSKELGVRVSYIYGYNKTLPIAQVTNVTDVILSQKTALVLAEMGYATLDDLLSFIGKLDTDPKRAAWALFNQKLREKFIGTVAAVTTYSFYPLIGVTSITDANNTVTYYEYDNFGRLQNVKDTSKDILNNYQYYTRTQQN